MIFVTQSGSAVGSIGQGTWYLGEDRQTFQAECTALRTGIEAGMNVIDTAEMYGEGAAETLVGEAIQGYDREKLFLVSKVYPWNAGKNAIFHCCENSLRRMRTDYMDLYLLHWRGSVPFSETVACMEQLKARGLIRAWGVSNLDMQDMNQLFQTENGTHCAANQVLYHLGSRGVEYDLLPWMRTQAMPLMAYCPLAQGGSLRRNLYRSASVKQVAAAHQATPAQIMLAFLLAQPGVLPIPRTGHAKHTLENAASMHITLSAEERALLNQEFPSPNHKTPLDIV